MVSLKNLQNYRPNKRYVITLSSTCQKLKLWSWRVRMFSSTTNHQSPITILFKIIKNKYVVGILWQRFWTVGAWESQSTWPTLWTPILHMPTSLSFPEITFERRQWLGLKNDEEDCVMHLPWPAILLTILSHNHHRGTSSTKPSS